MIRNWVLFLTVAGFTFAGLSAAEQPAQPAAKKTAPKTSASKQVPAKSEAVKSTAAKSGAARSTAAVPSAHATPRPASPSAAKSQPATSRTTRSRSKSPARPAPVTRRYRQAQPTPDRYREIQEALASKGYLKSEPSGVWDASSVEAMKQFQTEKNLAATGKITAPALIELGLGPRNQPMVGPPPVPDPSAGLSRP